MYRVVTQVNKQPFRSRKKIAGHYILMIIGIGGSVENWYRLKLGLPTKAISITITIATYQLYRSMHIFRVMYI